MIGNLGLSHKFLLQMGSYPFLHLFIVPRFSKHLEEIEALKRVTNEFPIEKSIKQPYLRPLRVDDFSINLWLS